MTKLFRLLLLKKTKTGAYIFSKGETIGAYILLSGYRHPSIIQVFMAS
jgi:hypothetical protein